MPRTRLMRPLKIQSGPQGVYHNRQTRQAVHQCDRQADHLLEFEFAKQLVLLFLLSSSEI
jgi:hypothetical protein